MYKNNKNKNKTKTKKENKKKTLLAGSLQQLAQSTVSPKVKSTLKGNLI